MSCAIRTNMDAIVTRNENDFQTTSLTIHTPTSLLATFTETEMD